MSGFFFLGECRLSTCKVGKYVMRVKWCKVRMDFSRLTAEMAEKLREPVLRDFSLRKTEGRYLTWRGSSMMPQNGCSQLRLGSLSPCRASIPVEDG